MAKRSRCPICGKDTAHETRPFCSRDCKDVDLSRWLSGKYVLTHWDQSRERIADAEDDAGVDQTSASRERE